MLPGGYARSNETVGEAIRREMLEETGLAVEPVEMVSVRSRVRDRRNDVYITFRVKVVGGELKPDGKEVKKTVTADKNGYFRDRLTADASGTWNVKVTMEGNAAVEAATSESVSFNAESSSPLSQIPIPWEAMLVGVSLGVILLVVRRRLPYRTYFGST
jgi:hypothetical protein